jgi:hypothetical protein
MKIPPRYNICTAVKSSATMQMAHIGKFSDLLFVETRLWAQLAELRVDIRIRLSYTISELLDDKQQIRPTLILYGKLA